MAVKITERLISHCDSQQVKLMADSYLNMIRLILESNTTTDLQIFATNSVSGVGMGVGSRDGDVVGDGGACECAQVEDVDACARMCLLCPLFDSFIHSLLADRKKNWLMLKFCVE